ncbi:hypothetical protein C5167_031219 [Papaver somniferum]|nr:hypothetical protein C5167_031219 [Papaver somniferum]
MLSISGLGTVRITVTRCFCVLRLIPRDFIPVDQALAALLLNNRRALFDMGDEPRMDVNTLFDMGDVVHGEFAGTQHAGSRTESKYL